MLPSAELIHTGVHGRSAPVAAIVVSAAQEHRSNYPIAMIEVDPDSVFMFGTAAQLSPCPIDRDADAQI